jgi:hypothetical protein
MMALIIESLQVDCDLAAARAEYRPPNVATLAANYAQSLQTKLGHESRDLESALALRRKQAVSIGPAKDPAIEQTHTDYKKLK